MAAAFNLTAQLNLQGPSNVGAIVTSIQKQLNNVSANVNVKINPATSQNIATLNAAFANFNTTLAITATNSTNAANAIRGLTTAIGQANNPLNNLQQNMTNNATAAAQLTQNLQNLNRTQNVCANDMEELGRQAAGTIRRFAAFGVVTGGIYKLGNAINSAAKEFLDFNKELVRVAQVTDSSLSNLASLTAQISQLSTTFGVASSDLIKVSSTLAQAGLSAKDTEKALKALALSALAPSFDSLNDTVEGSIALMRQFDISAGDLEGALGSVNAVAAKFAVEASDIITAIQRTGGVFATASRGVATGTEALNQFISVFTSIRATTRESAETIATGLRTIFTRVQRGGTIEALKNYGVVLTDLEGKFVGPYEAVKRLSEGLSRLDPRDLRFGEIVEELGGFRQIGKVIPLIQQFAVTQQALKVAQQGQASLAYDAATAQESVANKMTKVREEFVALIRSIGESTSFQTFVKLSLDLTSQLIRLADAAKNVLPAVLAIAAIRSGPAALSFGRGFIGGLRRNQGGPIGFAGGGFVPGQGDGDTVPAMLTPGEFVIRKKAVKAIGADRLAGINKYAKGGKVQDFGLVGLQGNSSNFNGLKSTEKGRQVNVYAGTTSPELSKKIQQKTIQNFRTSIGDIGDEFANAITPGKKAGREKINLIMQNTGLGNVIGSVLEGAIGLLGSPFIERKTEAGKAIDFPKGFGPAATSIFGVPSNIPTDATRTIGSKGKSLPDFLGQVDRWIDYQNKSSRGMETQIKERSATSIEQLRSSLAGLRSGESLSLTELQARIPGIRSKDINLKEFGLDVNRAGGKTNFVKRALGGSIDSMSGGLLSSLLKSSPLTYSPTTTISKLLKTENSENALKSIEAAYGIKTAKLIGSGAESAVFDIGKRILKISQGNLDLPRKTSGVAGYYGIKKFGQLTAALQQKLSAEAPAKSEDIDLLKKKLAKQGLNWEDAHEFNVGYNKKGIPKILDGKISKFAKGGSAEDTVPALLTPGEFVINKKAASRIGLSTLHKMNHADKVQGFASGGSVQKFANAGPVNPSSAMTKFLNTQQQLQNTGGPGAASPGLVAMAQTAQSASGGMFGGGNPANILGGLVSAANNASVQLKALTTSATNATQATNANAQANQASANATTANQPAAANTRFGRLKERMGGAGGIMLTMAGGAAIEGLSSAYGGEKTTSGRNISAIGGSMLNYGAVGASMGGLSGAILGATVGLVAGFAEAETAAKEYAVTSAASAKDMAAEFSGKSVSEYASAEKPTKEMRQAALTTLATTSLREQELATATRERAQPGFLSKSLYTVTGGYFGAKSVDANKLAQEQIKGQETSAAQSEEFLFAEMKRSGKTFAELSKSMNPEELRKLSLDIAEADKGYATAQELNKKEIMDRRAAGDESGAIEAEKYWAKEQQNLISAAVSRRMAEEDATIKGQQMAKAQQNMAVAIQKSIMSLERTFDIMEQTGNRFSFELDNVAENAKSIMGGKGAKQSGLSSTMNIIKNPEAYSADERKAAMQRGVSGLDPKTGRNLVRLASFAPNARNAALQISSQAGTDPESQREATEEIRRTLSAQIRTAFGGTDLSANMIKTLNDAITDATKDGAEINWDELLNKALGPSIKGAEGANKIIEQQLKIQADLYAQIADISELYVSNMEKVVDRTNTLTDMQEKARMSLRSAMGEKLTSKDKIALRTRSAADRAGMSTATYGNVGLMGLQISNIETQRDAKIREKEALENAGASPQQLAKVNIELANLQNSLKKAEKGLEELPNELQSNIDDMIGEIQDRVAKMEAKKEAGSKFAEKLVGNTPEEMMALNRTFGLLQNTLMGNITTINKSFVAQQAYAESLRGGKNAAEAMRDAQRAFADENKNALGLFSELMGVAGVEGPQFDMMKADLMENFAKAQGMGLEKNPMFQMILDQLRRDPAERAKEDPVVMALVEKIKKAQDMQTDAINTINNNAIANQQTAFTQAINEFTTKIEKAKLNLMINVQGAAFVGGQNPVAVNVVPGHANGGLIYASKGQHINFQPKGTDTVPAMLTPGEFVVNRKATQDNLPLLKSINSGYYAKGGYLNPTQLVSSATSGLIEYARADSMREQDPKDRKKTFFEGVSEIKSLTSGEKIVNEFARQFGFLTGEPISGINKFNALIGGPFDPGPENNLKSVSIDPVKKIDSIVAKIKDSPTQYLQAKSLSTNANKRWSYLEEIINNLNTGESIIKKDSIYKKIKPNKDELDTQMNMENTLSFMSAVKSNATNEQKLIRKVYDEVGKKTEFWFPVQDFRGFSPSNFPKADYFSSGGRARGTDTIPAMLTRGEFVVNKDATQKNLGLLKQINKGYSRGGAVQYYQNGGVAGGSSSNGVIDVLGGRLDNFIQQLSQAIPSTVRLEVPQPIPVNVVINGAGILQNVLGGPLGELIATQIREAFARQSRATEGAVGE